MQLINIFIFANAKCKFPHAMAHMIQIGWLGVLTLCIPVSSADNFGKQFGPRSGPTNRRA